MQQKRHLALLLGLGFSLFISAGTACAASAPTEMGGDVAVDQASPGSTGKATFSSPDASQAKSSSGYVVTFAPPTEEQKREQSRMQSTQGNQKSGGTHLIGIGLKSEAPDIDPSNLKWVNISGGRKAARFSVNSYGAESVRAGLVIGSSSGTLPKNLTLHFKGEDADIFEATDKDLQNNQLYWSPAVVGNTITIELVLPAGVQPKDLQLSVPQLSYFSSSYKASRYSDEFGRSGSCEVDAACSVQRSNPAYNNSVNAVAKTIMTNAEGNSYLCSATLLNNSNSPKRQLVWSAAHCIANQAEANTYQTIWFYATTQCGGNVSTIDSRVAVLTGGATILHRDERRDTLLMELKRTPPAGVFYQGWNAQQVATGTKIYDLHHPRGDVTKYSQGDISYTNASVRNNRGEITNTNMINVQWPAAVVEAGSSGSGLLTLASDGNYQLRGGLFGGPSECSAPTSTRYDYFSDFSGVFQQISRYLAP